MGMLADGFNTLITFSTGAANTRPGIAFIEREVTPPPLDGGGPIDLTAMRNVAWRTNAPKFLISLDKMMVKARYDPTICYAGPAAGLGFRNVINVNQLVGLVFPALGGFGGNLAPLGSVLTFAGYLNKFTPGTNKEGDLPLGDLEIQPTNQINGVETPPTLV